MWKDTWVLAVCVHLAMDCYTTHRPSRALLTHGHLYSMRLLPVPFSREADSTCARPLGVSVGREEKSRSSTFCCVPRPRGSGQELIL